MRKTILTANMLLFVLLCLAAQPDAAWTLSATESQDWLARIRELVPQRGWTVAAVGNEITITRDQPAPMRLYLPNAPAADEPPPGEPAGELALQLVLRFRPKMSMDNTNNCRP
jgi:hypothetical protein